MTSLLNRERPLVFCPGCSHEIVVCGLDAALQALDLNGNNVAIVSDIGCSGLFDTFFNTHAFHGLHGRALTYATGLKMARPDLTVIVIMGDGGLGIGGAHVLASCRRNLDITLLVLNNFNYGMTGGQCSATTPTAAKTASGFLNQLESPLDICQVAAAAGAPYAARTMATGKEVPEQIAAAISYSGFSLLDIWGICPGRYSKHNRVKLPQLAQDMAQYPPADGPVAGNKRQEYGAQYRKLASSQRPIKPAAGIAALYTAPATRRSEILLLGAAGQRINTAGELLCLAAMTAGLHVAQKNDYPITVLRGHSISEVILDRQPVGYTGIEKPSVVIAVAAEGIARKNKLFSILEPNTCIIKAHHLSIPETRATVVDIDFKSLQLKPVQWALAALAVLARENTIISQEMLQAALAHRYQGKVLEDARQSLRGLENIAE